MNGQIERMDEEIAEYKQPSGDSLRRILYVEDDHELSESVSDWLHHKSYLVDCCLDAECAMQALADGNNYDCLILDVDLPGMNGFDLCRRYRAGRGVGFILMLSGSSRLTDDISFGLDNGADDYMVKPFELRELSARVEAGLRRAGLSADRVLTVSHIQMDLNKKTVLVDGEPTHLSRLEYNVLELFMKSPGKFFSSQEIIDRVWRAADSASEETVRTLIKRLRQRLNGKNGIESSITTVAGVGYKLDN